MASSKSSKAYHLVSKILRSKYVSILFILKVCKNLFFFLKLVIDLRVIRAGIDMMVATLFPSDLSQPNGDPLQRRSDSVHLDEELRRKVAEEELKVP